MKLIVTRDMTFNGDVCIWRNVATPTLLEDGLWDERDQEYSHLLEELSYDDFKGKYGLEIDMGKKAYAELEWSK